MYMWGEGRMLLYVVYFIKNIYIQYLNLAMRCYCWKSGYLKEFQSFVKNESAHAFFLKLVHGLERKDPPPPHTPPPYYYYNLFFWGKHERISSYLFFISYIFYEKAT
jgi:hypothetical protein